MPVFIDGHHLITPTSVAKTGTGSTATINTNGSVTFSSCATLSLNGVFSSTYDNYIIVMRNSGSGTNTNLCLRLRASGTDSTGISYVTEELEATGTNIWGSRLTATRWFSSYTNQGGRGGQIINLYGPFLSQPTAFRQTSVYSIGSTGLMDDAGTHSESTSYDGLSILGDVGYEISGLVCVYGAVK